MVIISTEKYTSSIDQILDTDKKTILHIPNVNSGESTKDKLQEVDEIIDRIGRVIRIDDESKIIHVLRDDGKEIKLLIWLTTTLPTMRRQSRTSGMSSIDDVDLIIALGMAKEGSTGLIVSMR